MSLRVKIVPDDQPNSDGCWIVVEVDLPRQWAWSFAERLVTPSVPAGYHVVAMEKADA